MRLPIEEYDYDLPPELIAQSPVEPRDHSRLLVVDRQSQTYADHFFYELPELLRTGDLLVVNNTRVIQARLLLNRTSGGRVEMLFLNGIEGSLWEVIARPSRRLRVGEELEIRDTLGQPAGKFVTIVDKLVDGLVVDLEDPAETLAQFGHLPLPPYIENPNLHADQYQTVYSSKSGSAAAPTAGLHFTDQLIDRCHSAGIEIVSITLHIGLDTFQPVRVEDALQHKIHSEWYEVPEESMSQILAARNRGNRIIGVGTTSVRVLETMAQHKPLERDASGWTSLYITPPFNFQLTDGMITNFHLPRTTLLLMVTALAGRDLLFGAYRHAIEERYRFYSFGDAMLIV